ncbi:unnamed protein product, partial [Urochloa humidicola]
FFPVQNVRKRNPTSDLRDWFPDSDGARRDGATQSRRPRGDEVAARAGRVAARGNGVTAGHIPAATATASTAF